MLLIQIEKEDIPVKYRVFFLSLLLTASTVFPAAAVTLAARGSQSNSAPIAENLSLSTYKGIAITSRFAAVDPEGDSVTFQIVDSPARGQITLSEQDPAAFWYTPYEGKKGKDSFTYVAVDDKGNMSEPATVKIVIEKQTSKVTYSDMTGEAAAYAAQRLAEEGIYVGRRVGDNYCFDPDETFTREEFLALAMSVMGEQPLEGVVLTGFYDDESISTWAKGYVSAALIDGAVQGSLNGEGQPVFRGNAEVSSAEAAVIIDRLLSVSDTEARPTMTVPAWAAQSAANLETVSVIPANMELDGTLTRGDAALMLSAMLDVVENRADKNWLR